MSFIAVAVVVSILPFLLIAAIISPYLIAGIALVAHFLAWYMVRTHLPSDSFWRGFLTNIFGGMFMALGGLMITGLTLTSALVAIALAR